MLVDLRASVDQALGRRPSADAKSSVAKSDAKKDARAAAAGSAPAAKAARAAGASADAPGAHSPEFDVSGVPAWDPDAGSQQGTKK